MKAKKTVLMVAAVLLLALAILFGAQQMLRPEYADAGGLGAKGFFSLPQNSIDALFLGSSQAYCGVDTVRLTEVYGISSYTLAASAQEIPMTEYYLREALKTQHPSVVFVDVYNAFDDISPAGEGVLSWSFDTMPNTPEKEQALSAYLPDDLERSLFLYTPLLRWRSRIFTDAFWKELPLKLQSSQSAAAARGFLAMQPLEPQTFLFKGENDGPVRTLSQASMESLMNMAALCNEEGVRLVLVKLPIPCWTRNDHNAVRTFAEEHQLTFVDLNECLDSIGLDGTLDTYGPCHLSASGAAKTADYLALERRDLLE